jgi:hypothetical protein
VIDFENRDFAWVTLEKAMKMLGNDDSRRVLTFAEKRILEEKGGASGILK